MHNILCFSGGVDSVVAYHSLKHFHSNLETVFFSYGGPYNDMEEYFVRNKWPSVTYRDTSLNFEDCQSVYIPNRNLLFASRAAAIYEDNKPVTVWIAGLKDDMVEDKTKKAFKVMSKCLTQTGRKEVTVRSPFWGLTKSEVCMYLSSFVNAADEVLRDKTFSCYTPDSDGTPCYQCKACYRKACAMFNVGMVCPFNSAEIVDEYREKAYARKYIPERCMDILCFTKYFMEGHVVCK